MSAIVLVLTAAAPATAQAKAKPIIPTCFGEKATIVGTKGADRITLTKKHDVVVSLGGNDTIVPEFYVPDDGSASDPSIYASLEPVPRSRLHRRRQRLDHRGPGELGICLRGGCRAGK